MSFHHPERLESEAKILLNTLWEKRNSLSAKDRLAIPVQEMPSQNPEERISNFAEVALGYSETQAKLEALRCLQCKNKPCVIGCPVKIEIPSFIQAIIDGNLQKAADIIKENSLLPAVCGRVCPQEDQCQKPCTAAIALKDPNKAVSIGRLERFVADWGMKNGAKTPSVKKETGIKFAIIGSGPGGIVAAADLRREGHSVTMFEAFHKPGGVMIYGIPEFRLPKVIVEHEISTLIKMGVEVRTDFVVGRTRKLLDLINKDGYKAAFIATGAGLPKFMNIEGESLVGVFSSNEYLTRINLMKAYDREVSDTPLFLSKTIAVFGGGNVAMDTARSARRMGSTVHLFYRRTENEMPARKEEIENAKYEGIIFHTLQNAKRFIGDQYGKLKAIECLKYELGNPDSSGRPRPVEIKGSEFSFDTDAAIVAIGNECNPLISKTTPGLNANKWGNIIIDDSGKTSLDKIYAGGDIVLGSATVILAMGQGRTAAQSINNIL
ncbi:MAG: NADPH-dependent glutamate synthase [Candidatus Omnitrophica bacterium]|nr:NADPH-dependent glutamate synthase [Candidatus Omnitrophota bacterium]